MTRPEQVSGPQYKSQGSAGRLTRHFSLFPNARLQHLLFATSVFCCWMMWAIIYMAQMNPLVVPILSGPE